MQVYRSDMDEHTVERLSLVGDLQAAAQNGEFERVFQPQIDLLGAGVISLEALTRWRHPVHGEIAPDLFIPLAENSELITTMTREAVESSLAAVRGGVGPGRQKRRTGREAIA